MNISNVPKVELHCHLDGIISPRMVRDILIEEPGFPVSPDDFKGKLPIQGYDSFWNWWSVIDPLEGSLKNFQPVLKHYIASLKAQNVHYFELMIAAGELQDDIGAAVDDLHQFREWMNVQEAGQIQVEFLVVLNRSAAPEKLEARTNKVIRLHQENLVCGIAFAGPEPNHPVKPYHHLFMRLHEAGVGIEIHAGEWVGSESVWDAIHYGFPDRIGHGISLFQDERLIHLFQEKQIHLELCPTSNLKTGSVDRIENHPIRRAYDLGLNFSISTDDPGPFECDMNGEYELVHNTFGFTEAEFKVIYKNGLDARFQKNLRIPSLIQQFV